MDYNWKEFGARVKQYRKQKGYSQLELSALMEVDADYFPHIENGKRRPSSENLIAMAHILEVSVDQLVYGLREHDEKRLHAILANATEEETAFCLKLLPTMLEVFRTHYAPAKYRGATVLEDRHGGKKIERGSIA